jgi:hypothetical protein
MKNYSVLHFILFLLLMLIHQCTKAQDYLVTAKGDTLKGDIRLLSFGPEKKVQLTTSDKKKSTYSILQTRSFNLKDEKYTPVRKENGYVFMKVIKEGYLSLYAFQQPNQITYDGLYLYKKDGNGMEVPNLTFKKHMLRYVADCPELKAKIDVGELGKRDLENIVDEYNRCIAGNTRSYEKVIVQERVQSKKISAWDVLEEKIKAKEDFEGKADALDMITEIKSKIKSEEKVPNFMLEGLKRSLANAGMAEELQNALNELN